MNKRRFYQNTAVMTGCSLLLRLMGILFRIFISNRVGSEGMGLYQLVLSVHILGSTFATGGLTTAVTRLAGERLAHKDNKAVCKLLKIGGLLSFTVGGLSALVLFFSAPVIGGWLGDDRAADAVAICGLGLPFIGVSCCLQGYFLARRQAWPPCAAQLAEQVVRIGGILLMLNTLWDGSLGGACVLIILGDALAEAVNCLVLMVAYRRDRNAAETHPSAPQKLLKPLLHITLPLTGSRYLSTGLRTVENILVPARLALFTGSEALALAEFGAVKGMALPLVFFPSALLMTLTGLLVPELSDAHALGQRRQVTRLVEQALHITLPEAILVGGLFTLLGRELGEWLYSDSLVGLLLQILGPLTPVMYLDSIATGMLKGLGQQVHSLWYSVIDSAVRIALIWWLLPSFGLAGFLFVMLVSNLLTCLLSTGRLLEVSQTRMQWGRWVLRPVLAAGIAGGACRLLPLSGLWNLVVSAVLFSLVYIALVLLFRCFTKEDWRTLTSRKTKQKTAVG